MKPTVNQIKAMVNLDNMQVCLEGNDITVAPVNPDTVNPSLDIVGIIKRDIEKRFSCVVEIYQVSYTDCVDVYVINIRR